MPPAAAIPDRLPSDPPRLVTCRQKNSDRALTGQCVERMIRIYETAISNKKQK
jgi:hypothetical protein